MVQSLRPTLVLMFWVTAECAVLPGAEAQYKQRVPGNSDGYYEDTNYIMWRVLAAAVVGVFIAIMACVCGCCFCCLQVCAKCGCDCIKERCGCCGAGEAAPEGYTQKQRLVLVGILFVAFAFIVTGSGLGYDGNAKVKDGLDELASTSASLADEIYDQVKMGYDAAVLVSTSTISSQMVTDADKLRTDVKDAGKTLRDTDEIRLLAVYVFYGIMMAVPILGFLSWICGVATLSYIMTQICFCMLFVAWLFFGLTFASGTLMDDTCVEAGKQVYGEANALSELLECGDGTSSQTTYDDVWQTLDTAQANYGLSVQETSYGFTTNTYSSAAGAVNSQDYTRNKDLLLGMYNSYGVVSSTCESMTDETRIVLCYVPTVSESNYDSLCGSSGSEPSSARCSKQSQILSAAGMTGSSYLISCEHLNRISLDLNNKICDPMVDGLINVCVGQAFIGFFYFFVLAVGCMGMNRFNNENYADSQNTAQVQPQKADAEPGSAWTGNQYTPDQPSDGSYSAELAMAGDSELKVMDFSYDS